jgi:hypothetical protein
MVIMNVDFEPKTNGELPEWRLLRAPDYPGMGDPNADAGSASGRGRPIENGSRPLIPEPSPRIVIARCRRDPRIRAWLDEGSIER